MAVKQVKFRNFRKVLASSHNNNYFGIIIWKFRTISAGFHNTNYFLWEIISNTGYICSLPRLEGPCDGAYERWYFNPESGQSYYILQVAFKLQRL